jgi:membrane dipeptidase
MQKARVSVCLGTLLVRAKSSVCPAEGFDRRDLDVRTQSIACAIAQGQRAYYRQLSDEGHVQPVRTSADLAAHWERTQSDPRATPAVGLILAMEGADPIVDPGQVEQWWDDGLRCVGLAHYGQGCYAVGTGDRGPLTPRGRALLREMERLGMVLDLTHCAEPGFFEALDVFGGRVIASHNMSRALVPGDRQFSDEQIRALTARGALIGMACDAWMLCPNWKTGQTPRAMVPLSTLADHVDHVCQIAGSARHVGIGSDLDGGYGNEQCPQGLDSIADLHKLEPILRARGYSEADIDGLFVANFLRFFREALPEGTEKNWQAEG